MYHVPLCRCGTEASDIVIIPNVEKPENRLTFSFNKLDCKYRNILLQIYYNFPIYLRDQNLKAAIFKRSTSPKKDPKLNYPNGNLLFLRTVFLTGNITLYNFIIWKILLSLRASVKTELGLEKNFCKFLLSVVTMSRPTSLVSVDSFLAGSRNWFLDSIATWI